MNKIARLSLALLLGLGCMHCAAEATEDGEEQTANVDVVTNDVDTAETKKAPPPKKDPPKHDYMVYEIENVLITSY